jgi:hypothetical protein
MMRKLGFNLLIGALGFVITFLTSSINNLYMTSLIRSFIAFVIWFLLSLVFKWIMGIMTTRPDDGTWEEGEIKSDTVMDQRGVRFDLTLPDDSEELNDLLKPKPESSIGGDHGFTPLNPPKLVSAQDPEQLAKAVRHLTEK